MPIGGDPPDPALPQSVFNALHGLSYDSTSKAFASGSTKYYLFVEKDSGGAGTCRWFYATDADGGVNPRGLVAQITYDVIHFGTFNSSTGTVTYNSQTYRIRLKRDTTNAQWAEAHVSS